MNCTSRHKLRTRPGGAPWRRSAEATGWLTFSFSQRFGKRPGARGAQKEELMHLAIEILTIAAILAGCFFVAVPAPDMQVRESPKPFVYPERIVMVPRGIMGGNSHDRRLARRRLERAAKLANA